MPDAGDPGVQTLNTAFSLGPIVAELYFVAQLLLRLAERSLMFSKTVKRCMTRAIGERGELFDAHIDANLVSCWYGNLDLPFGLNGHVPLVVRATTVTCLIVPSTCRL